MYKLSDIISMQVLSIYDSKIVGIVANLTLDPKTNKCKQIVIVSTDDVKYTLDYSNISKIGKNSIVISNISKVNLYENNECSCNKYYNPINAEIYDTDGTLIGRVADIILDDKLKATNLITTSSHTLDIKNIVTYTDSIVIYSQNKIKLSRLKPKSKIQNIVPSTNTKVNILPIVTPPTKVEATLSTSSVKVTDTRTILGRTTTKDIFSINHELIIKNNEIITKNTITTASKYGKLIELFKYSK